MIAEQTVTSRYKLNDHDTNIEIQMTIQLQTPADEPYADVMIEHLYEPIFPDAIWDECFQHLNNGVNGGIWLSSIAVSPYSVYVKILELKVSPSPQSILDSKAQINLGYLLEVTISGIVDTLRRNLENLRSGVETYLEWPESPSDDESEDDSGDSES